MTSPLLTIRDPDDEAVGTGQFHIEQLDDNQWWMAVDDAHGCQLRIVLTARGRIRATMDISGECGEKR